MQLLLFVKAFMLSYSLTMPFNPLLLTLGDPGGLGPELAVRHFAEDPPVDRAVVLIGPEKPLAAMAERFAPGLRWTRLEEVGQGMAPGLHLLEPTDLCGLDVPVGKATREGGRAAGLSLGLACDLLLAGEADALVTCPLNKAMLQEAGFDFPGHTEFLAQRAGLGPDEVTMHLCGPRLRVSLVTTHPPLRDVPGMITCESVLRAVRHTCAFAARLGLATPVAVCGLNPHAGESGRIGREEIEVIAPAIEEARAEGLPVEGPFPADTVFHRAARGDFAAVLAMYHDQGLGPLKLLHFGEAVNVTLGLPFVRTSVDHGTGYDIAGQGSASLGSLRAAINLAERLG